MVMRLNDQESEYNNALRARLRSEEYIGRDHIIAMIVDATTKGFRIEFVEHIIGAILEQLSTQSAELAVQRAKDSKPETREKALQLVLADGHGLPVTANDWKRIGGIEAFLRDGYLPIKPETKAAA